MYFARNINKKHFDLTMITEKTCSINILEGKNLPLKSDSYCTNCEA